MKKKSYIFLMLGVLLFLFSCGSDTKGQLESVQSGPKEITWNIGPQDLEVFSTLEESNVSGIRNEVQKIRNKSNSQSINYILDSILASDSMITKINALIEEVEGITSGTEDLNNERMIKVLDFYNDNSKEMHSLLKTYIDNFEKSYKANEIVRFSTELTEGQVAILYPDHFKTLSGMVKVMGAQITLMSAYNLENNSDFITFKTNYNNYVKNDKLVPFVNYLKGDFKNSSIFNRNITQQVTALNYMKSGIKELEVSLRAIPTYTLEEEKSKNILALNDGDRNTILFIVDSLSTFLKDNGGTIKVGDTSYTMNLNKLYQLDIKNLVNELLTGTDGLITTVALDAKIKENINNSTFQGVFPNKIPQNMIKENVSLSTSLNFKKAN